MISTVRVLSFHADYGCRHRGRCCSSGWPIAVEGDERTRFEHAIDAGVLTPAGSPSSVFSSGARPGPSLLASSHGHCVFHDDTPEGGCRIHRAMGHAALPLACRQFPRQSVSDPRGVSVTLSHYCPTASDLLIDYSGRTTIVDNAPAFPREGEYVGLTADPSLPPLLHPRLAMDWESWWLFEELSVSLLSEERSVRLSDARGQLSRLALAVEYARGWTVESGMLSTHLREAFRRARTATVPVTNLSNTSIDERIGDVLAAVPADWRGAATNALSTVQGTRLDEAIAGRFLSAHAFANWAAYQGEGLRTWFRAVETAAAVLSRTADPGRADLLLRHLSDSTALIDRWRRAEAEPAIAASG
ncbi:MAG TPA: hypothetical protein VMZ90_04415 [Vicinamibacterales bacterium]|nr:hypothetical protein [Vicinamibacterales bacterium]